jgi:hypothetical protein
VFICVGLLVGVLSFTAGDPGLPYSVAPTPAQLGALGDRLAHDLRAAGTPARHIGGSCTDAACARRAGAAHHLSRVVFSSATRHLAMIWTAQSSVVDVASGRVSGPYDIGYKGDYEAIRAGLDSLAAALLPAVGDTSAFAHVNRARQTP